MVYITKNHHINQLRRIPNQSNVVNSSDSSIKSSVVVYIQQLKFMLKTLLYFSIKRLPKTRRNTLFICFLYVCSLISPPSIDRFSKFFFIHKGVYPKLVALSCADDGIPWDLRATLKYCIHVYHFSYSF